MSETRTSGGTFLLSLTYCSNCVTTARASASTSRIVGRRVLEHAGGDLEEVGDCRRSRRSRRAAVPSTSTLTVPSGSLSSCSTLDDRADAIDVVRSRDRPGSRSSARPAGSACRPSSPPRAPRSTSRGRRRAARSCAERPRCRARVEPEKSLSWVSRPLDLTAVAPVGQPGAPDYGLRGGLLVQVFQGAKAPA